MKHFTFLILITLFYCVSFSQTKIEIFSENGEKFHVVINGVSQNDEPKTNVKIDSIFNKDITLTIVFEDTLIPFLKKSIQTRSIDNEYYDISYIIKKNKKGKYELLQNVSSATKTDKTIRTISVISNAIAETAKKQEQDRKEKEKKQKIANNIYTYLYVDKTYNTKLFGTENLKIFITNTSGFKMDKIVVQVNFFGNTTNNLYCSKLLTLTNIPGDSKKYDFPGPNCSDGKKIVVKIQKVVSEELGIY